jgi:hypothetical protein
MSLERNAVGIKFMEPRNDLVNELNAEKGKENNKMGFKC